MGMPKSIHLNFFKKISTASKIMLGFCSAIPQDVSEIIRVKKKFLR